MSRVELSKSQRQYILERDSHYCQFPIHLTDNTYRPSRRIDSLQIHHIVAYRFAQVYLGWSDEQINDSSNLITLSEKYHLGIIHPDILVAKELNREGNKNAFNECFAHRRRLTDKGEPYWYTAYDDIFKRIVTERERIMHKADKFYPQKLRRVS